MGYKWFVGIKFDLWTLTQGHVDLPYLEALVYHLLYPGQKPSDIYFFQFIPPFKNAKSNLSKGVVNLNLLPFTMCHISQDALQISTSLKLTW